MPACRDCYCNVVFATTLAGRKICLDPIPGWRGRYIIEEGRTGEKFAKVVTGRPAEPTRHTLHQTTCSARNGSR